MGTWQAYVNTTGGTLERHAPKMTYYVIIKNSLLIIKNRYFYNLANWSKSHGSTTPLSNYLSGLGLSSKNLQELSKTLNSLRNKTFQI